MQSKRTLLLKPTLPSPASDDDITVMARTLWGEARGEVTTGIIAVAWVILNRVRADIGADGRPDWWGEGIVGVCCKPWQFSCWNENDPNRAKMLALAADDPQLRKFRIIAKNTSKLAFDGDPDLKPIWSDPTNGAVAYATSKLIATNPPQWAVGRTPCATIGAHAFFKEVF